MQWFYQETFAPVVRHSPIRLLLALSTKHILLVNHIDIVAAYLNGDIEDDVCLMTVIAQTKFVN